MIPRAPGDSSAPSQLPSSLVGADIEPSGSLKADRVAALAAGAAVLVAYGDALADVPLLDLAAEAIAVAPDRDLRPVAIARGWRILDDPPGVVA